jgi:hypothetical protein
MRPRRKPSPIASSTRAERAAEDHSSDYGDVRQRYPQLGRDVPAAESPFGYPVMNVDLRVQAYGEHGLRRETKCPHCSRWLSYRMCPGCQSLLRMMGVDDRACECFTDSLWIYGRCEDHRVFEQGPPFPTVASSGAAEMRR